MNNFKLVIGCFVIKSLFYLLACGSELTEWYIPTASQGAGTGAVDFLVVGIVD